MRFVPFEGEFETIIPLTKLNKYFVKADEIDCKFE